MDLRPNSLRWWLGGLVVAVAAPVLLLLIAMSVTQVRREQAEARMAALRTAKASATRIHDRYNESLRLIADMARRPAIVRMDPQACKSVFAAIDFFPRYADILLFDDAGNVVCSGNTDPANDLVSQEAQKWISSRLHAGQLPLQIPIVQQFASHSVAVLVSRVAPDAGRIVLLEFVEMIGRDALIPGSVMTILDQNRTIIARSQSGLAWAGRNARGTPIADLSAKSPEGVAEAAGVDGITRQYGFARVPDFGWTVYVGVPNSMIIEPVREMLLNGAIGGIAILFVVGIMTLLVARNIGTPIQALVAASTTADEGSYARVSRVHGPKEIATLTTSFNRMVDRREETDHQMRVGERKLKALHERLLAVQEEERGRIARELHDDLGQSLTALKMDFLGFLKASKTTPAAEPIAQRILTTLETTVDAVQRISSELRPSVLDDLGLIAAIREEARLFEERTGIECEVSAAGAVPAETEVVTAIYRVVQEALTNVTRHSNATRTELRLRERDGELLLEIRDDGVGVTTEQLGDPHSLGLIGIRERVALIGGTVQIEGVPGRGTIVSARIPMDTETRRS